MRYLHTMVRVKDLDAALKFYCDGLGMYEVRRKSSDKGRFTLVFLAARGDQATADINGGDRASPHIELTYNWPDENGAVEDYGNGRNMGHLAYEVEDIYALCQHLQDMGITILRPPRDGNMAFVKSPDGISIELLQAGDPLAPAEPWASMANTGSW